MLHSVILRLFLITVCLTLGHGAVHRKKRDASDCVGSLSQFNRRCYMWGDPHYRTFDTTASETWINFQGDCLYQLSGTKPSFVEPDPFNLGEMKFRVLGLNVKRNDKPVTYTDKVIIEWRDSLVIMKRKEPGASTGTIETSGTLAGACVAFWPGRTFLDPDIICGNSEKLACPGENVMVFQAINGFRVCYNGDHIAAITVPNDYCNELEGICGNFNQEFNDDWTTKDGVNVFDVPNRDYLVGDSWKVKEGYDCIPPSCRDDGDRIPNFNKISGPARTTCRVLDPNILKEMGVKDANFRICLRDFSRIFNRIHKTCLFDATYAGVSSTAKRRLVCDHLSVAISECEDVTGSAIMWRTEQNCGLSCQAPYIYSRNTSSCPRTCSNPNPRCPIGPSEHCVCPPGTLRLSNKCVSPSQCQCVDNAMKLYNPGEMWLNKDCTIKYTCGSNFKITSKPHRCTSGECCVVQRNGFGSCEPCPSKTTPGSSGNSCRKGGIDGECKPSSKCKRPNKCWFPCGTAPCPAPLVCCLPKKVRKKLCRGGTSTGGCSHNGQNGKCKPERKCKHIDKCPAKPCPKGKVCCLKKKPLGFTRCLPRR